LFPATRKSQRLYDLRLKRVRLHPGTDAVDASHGHLAPGEDELDIGVEPLDSAIEVALVIGLVALSQPGDSFVVRHRPRSIALWP
jgi:hypothetical protein